MGQGNVGEFPDYPYVRERSWDFVVDQGFLEFHQKSKHRYKTGQSVLRY